MKYVGRCQRPVLGSKSKTVRSLELAEEPKSRQGLSGGLPYRVDKGDR